MPADAHRLGARQQSQCGGSAFLTKAAKHWRHRLRFFVLAVEHTGQLLGRVVDRAHQRNALQGTFDHVIVDVLPFFAGFSWHPGACRFTSFGFLCDRAFASIVSRPTPD